nr:hypothetical protein CFP56_69474 [Quercus suber]
MQVSDGVQAALVAQDRVKSTHIARKPGLCSDEAEGVLELLQSNIASRPILRPLATDDTRDKQMGLPNRTRELLAASEVQIHENTYCFYLQYMYTLATLFQESTSVGIEDLVLKNPELWSLIACNLLLSN